MLQSVLTSAQTYRQGYRYRLPIEAAGILEPTFRVDRDALMRRLDRLRRLMANRKAVDRDQAARRCREHLTLIDLLAAADFMKLHLHNAVREKTSD
ncbi:hypothetical protein [Burkholderia anthina]|uniref:hypothetical protein n=1 Tax=Burkholderia anthina TaxID=179879 RepID=UPI0037BE5723